MNLFPLIAAVLMAALGTLATGSAQAAGLELVYPQLWRGHRRGHLALVARRQRRAVDALRGQLLSAQAHPGLAALGHRCA